MEKPKLQLILWNPNRTENWTKVIFCQPHTLTTVQTLSYYLHDRPTSYVTCHHVVLGLVLQLSLIN